LGLAFDHEPDHFEPVSGGGLTLFALYWIAIGGDEENFLELEGFEGGLSERKMAIVGRVEGSAEDTDFHARSIRSF
jgi:hypothetical protein